ncbi:hypothetical protein Hypma_004102 [Hypsizygus marmoreus]|uniref:Uncharacterized protein n=1 Tax=Hypsizygus marmoreus TaxID=39966 RepID=A0A369JYN0_HYPMA|nr:hypothetical protein Hypma_004102 [Hypsizygus marmoreus]
MYSAAFFVDFEWFFRSRVIRSGHSLSVSAFISTSTVHKLSEYTISTVSMPQPPDVVISGRLAPTRSQ